MRPVTMPIHFTTLMPFSPSTSPKFLTVWEAETAMKQQEEEEDAAARAKAEQAWTAEQAAKQVSPPAGG